MGEHDFLIDLRATEQQAADLIDQARENARKQLEQTREEAAGMVTRSRTEAARIQKQLLTAAELESSMITSQSEEKSRISATINSSETAVHLEQAARLVAERIVSMYAHR